MFILKLNGIIFAINIRGDNLCHITKMLMINIMKLKIKKEFIIKKLKTRLVNELSSEQMIKILFENFINQNKSNVEIGYLANNYLK